MRQTNSAPAAPEIIDVADAFKRADVDPNVSDDSVEADVADGFKG